MLRRTPLARTGPIPRTTPLARKAAGSSAQRVAYRQVDEESNGRCLGCGGTWFLTHSHCYSQKQHPAHRNDPRNILILCVNCHPTFEHNKPRFRRVCPDAWEETLVRMEEVDSIAFHRFRTLNPHLFT